MSPVDSGSCPGWREEGFEQWPLPAGFGAILGSVFRREVDATVTFRIRVRESHCNAHGRAHGGFLATLTDVALAYGVAPRLPAGAHIVTTNLDVTYLRAVHAGAVIDTCTDCLLAGSRLIQARCALYVFGEARVEARGTFLRTGQ